MLPQTRKKFNQLQNNMIKSYGLNDAKETFSVTPPIETKLNAAVQESSEFLKKITQIGVTDKVGRAVTLGSRKQLAKRTDTTVNARNPSIFTDLIEQEYRCEKTEFDSAISYELLDDWASKSDFMQIYAQSIYKNISLDRIAIGFLGQKAEKEATTIETMNIGWLELLKQNNPANFLTESSNGTNKITLGANGDYKNLDQLVYDVYSMIPYENRTSNESVIIGRNLIAHFMSEALAKFGEQPSERTQLFTVEKIVSGLSVVTVPYFPENSVMVTDLKNLHFYYQKGKMRRKQFDNPEKDQIEDFISSNECYFFGDFNGVAAIEASNVELMS